MEVQKHTNSLKNETSPYLLRHAHNPVDWQPWGEEAIRRAEKEGKLLIVSIGYSACHWCHVMEQESFGDEEVAAAMNRNFISIKVDREERPDIDHYYMTAVRLMQQQGGWPLNVIALPDGRPIWGGTYFPKDMWVKNIIAISRFFKVNKEKTIEYAENIRHGIRQVLLIPKVDKPVPVSRFLTERAVNSWKEMFDMKYGGRLGRPKFPMPVTLDFLMFYGYNKKDWKILDYVRTTLIRMARGGIYDQIGGGFARYSTDEKWKIPHFEKMLYDNGQLLSLYSKGYQLFKNSEFKTVVYETVDFLVREMSDDTGAFYSSVDADSDGEEGKFYVWEKKELEEIIGKDFDLFSDYFNINPDGLWENGNYILLRGNDDETFARNKGLRLNILNAMISEWKSKLLKRRGSRVHPGLDDKFLTSWNALVIQGLTDAYKAFGDSEFLNMAEKTATFILNHLVTGTWKLYHSWKAGKCSVDGFMDDYAFTIQAFISLFEVSGNVVWLNHARCLSGYALKHFFDPEKKLYLFSGQPVTIGITDHFQNEDNVVPSANSVMAHNLHKLNFLLGRTEYLFMVKKMLDYVTPQFTKYPIAYDNWGSILVKLTEPYFEVAVVGENARSVLKELRSGYHPNVLWAPSESESRIPLLQNRYLNGETRIYVCREGVCQLPVVSVGEALDLLNNMDQKS